MRTNHRILIKDSAACWRGPERGRRKGRRRAESVPHALSELAGAMGLVAAAVSRNSEGVLIGVDRIDGRHRDSELRSNWTGSQRRGAHASSFVGKDFGGSNRV